MAGTGSRVVKQVNEAGIFITATGLEPEKLAIEAGVFAQVWARPLTAHL